MKIIFRANARLLDGVRADLSRRHRFAAERVGFITVRAAAATNQLLLLADRYHPVADEDYVEDSSVGAMMGQDAIRKALNIALLEPVGLFHVHMHGHKGHPGFSKIDLSEQIHFVPDFFKVRKELPHGALVLSKDRVSGRCWTNADTIYEIAEFNVVGWRYTLFEGIRARLTGAST